MSVILELSLSAAEFELGSILELEEEEMRVSLETMVPLADETVPFVRLFDSTPSSFEESVRAHPAVDDLQRVDIHEEEELYAIDWTISQDTFFDCMLEANAHLLRAYGTTESWDFELRFPSHEAVSQFQDYCRESAVYPEIERIFHPTETDAGQWHGLTDTQRKTLARAVEEGYYAIPRETSTEELAAEFGISDQAVTERLRRAIDTLAENTLAVSE